MKIPNAHIVRFTYDSIFKGTALQAWYAANKSVQFLSNLSDGLRLAVLFKFGGVYLDMDVVSLQPLIGPLSRIPPNSVGIQDNDGGGDTLSANDDCHHDSFLNGGTMVFEAGNAFVGKLVHEFAQNFSKSCRACNGPKLISRVWQREYKPEGVGDNCTWKDNRSVSVLPVTAFEPVYWGYNCHLICWAPPEDASGFPKGTHVLHLVMSIMRKCGTNKETNRSCSIAHETEIPFAVNTKYSRTKPNSLLEAVFAAQCPSLYLRHLTMRSSGEG
jgi:hypothetical protein